MGEPKALLDVEGRTFTARVVGALLGGGCERVLVVVGGAGDGTAAAVAAVAVAAGAEVVENALAEAEQIDSLRAGLRALDGGVAAAVVTPVDLPRLTAEVVARLIAAFRADGGSLALPVYGGRNGHPVLFSRAVFPELLEGELPEGARSVVHAHAADRLEVPVEEPGVLLDVDTPADYRRLLREAGE